MSQKSSESQCSSPGRKENTPMKQDKACLVQSSSGSFQDIWMENPLKSPVLTTQSLGTMLSSCDKADSNSIRKLSVQGRKDE